MNADIIIAFFILGILIRFLRVDMQFPKGLYESLSLYLMLAIGLKGGVALADHASSSLILQSMSVILLGVVIALIAFPILFFIGQFDKINSGAIAAHYGSVSIGTYAIAIAILESQNIAYEGYFPLFVVLLEIPAIAAGIVLAGNKAQKINYKKFIHHTFFNQAIVLMVGGLIIGYLASDRIDSISPFFNDLFYGVLALFLLEMGLVTGKQIKNIKSTGVFILAFGVFMPLISAVVGGILGNILGLTTGGVILLATLAASASYIAVPAAMRIALPSANPGLSMTASLGITFPFNILIGIQVYIYFGKWLTTL